MSNPIEKFLTPTEAKALKLRPLSSAISQAADYWIISNMIQDCIKQKVKYAVVSEKSGLAVWFDKPKIPKSNNSSPDKSIKKLSRRFADAQRREGARPTTDGTNH